MKLVIVGKVSGGTMSQIINLPNDFAVKELHEFMGEEGRETLKTIYKVSPGFIVADVEDQ